MVVLTLMEAERCIYRWNTIVHGATKQFFKTRFYTELADFVEIKKHLKLAAALNYYSERIYN